MAIRECCWMGKLRELESKLPKEKPERRTILIGLERMEHVSVWPAIERTGDP